MTFLDLKESFFKRYSHIVIILKNKEMKKKIYEVPAILVYKTAPTMPLCNSGGDIEEWARGVSFDAEEFDAEEFDEDKFEDEFVEDEENY